MSQFPVSIAPATPGDIESLVDISVRSFKEDKNTQFKENAYGSGWFRDCMMGVTRDYINNMEDPTPGRVRLTVLKAVDESSGRIIGHVTWGEQGLEEVSREALGTRETGISVRETGKRDTPKDETTTGRSNETPPQSTAKLGVAELEKLTSNHMNSFVQRIMPKGARCMFICQIAVHPEFQGRGIGKTLIRWGTRKADEHEVICWVHLSEAGWSVFEKLGWQMEDSLSVDLDEYADNIPVPDGEDRWGSYTFRCAVRQPGLET